MNSVWRVAICTLALQQTLWADEAQLSSVSDTNPKR
jgi:hypothetical protein